MNVGNHKRLTGWKATAAVSMSNYIDSGSIIAIATSLGFWGAKYFPGDDGTVAGLLAAFSSNALGAAIGALIGGPLCDKYGRKFIYTYDLLLYALGGLLVTFTMNLPMLFIGFVVIGLAVGASVPAGWTYIAEFAPRTGADATSAPPSSPGPSAPSSDSAWPPRCRRWGCSAAESSSPTWSSSPW